MFCKFFGRQMKIFSILLKLIFLKCVFVPLRCLFLKFGTGSGNFIVILDPFVWALHHLATCIPLRHTEPFIYQLYTKYTQLLRLSKSGTHQYNVRPLIAQGYTHKHNRSAPGQSPNALIPFCSLKNHSAGHLDTAS